MMKHYLLSLFSLLAAAFGAVAPAAADDAPAPVRLEYRQRSYPRGVRLVFAEPVATLEQVQVSRRSDLSLADRGLDKFTVTGDDAHRPEMYWADQDTLCITPAKGTPAGTEFRLTVTPGQTYLGGAEIAPREYAFAFPGPALRRMGLVGVPGIGVVLSPEEPDGNIVCPPLTPDCGVEYSFAELKRKNEESSWKETGRTVRGHAEPLLLKHDAAVAELVARAKSLQPETLTQESILPGAVLVVPDEALPAEENTAWQLCYDPAATGYSKAKLREPLFPDYELDTYLDREDEEKNAPDGAGKHRVVLHFSDAVEKSELPRLFAALRLRLGAPAVPPDQDCAVEAGEVTEENGKLCRRAEWNGRAVTFTCEGAAAVGYVPENCIAGAEEKGRLTYSNPTQTHGMLVSVETDAPLTLEVSVPGGTLCSALGKPQKGEHRHRLTLNPAMPVVAVTESESPTEVLLPRCGDGKLGLTVFSGSRLEITPTFFSPQAVADTREAWQAFRTQAAEFSDVEQYDPEGYARCRRKLRRHFGLDGDSHFFATAEMLLKERQHNKEWYAAQKEYRRCRAQLVKLGDTAAPSVFELPGDAKGSVQQTVELKSLIGSAELKPGLYLLHLKLVPDAAADEAGRALGCKKACIERDIVVRVQGLKLSLSSDMAVVHRLADGALAEEGTLLLPGRSEPTEVKQGVAVCPPSEDFDIKVREALVLAEDDWGSADYTHRCSSKAESSVRAELLSDRRFYRPGEKVHVFGMVRRVLPDGHSECAGDAAGLRFSVRRPDRKKLLTQAVIPHANGTFEAEFTLPDGEEDVTGLYWVNLEDARHRMQGGTLTVESQVFRRDAFTLSADLAVAKVAPDHLTYTLTATDLNGTPLANAKVQLSLSTGSQDLLAGAEKAAQLTAELRTDAEGKLVWNCPLEWAAVKPESAMESMLYLQAVVRNDREEVRQIGTHAMVSRTDFRVQRPVENRLRLVSAEDEKKPLPHEQVLHARITCPDEERTELPNGFAWVKETERTLWEGDLRFPANDEEGLDLPELPEQSNNRSSMTTLYLTGHDSAGREYRSMSRHYSTPWQRDISVMPTTGQDALEVTTDTAGQAYLLVQQGEELGTPRPLTLKRGQQRIPLPADLLPAGSSAVFLLQPTADKKGFYTSLQGSSARMIKHDPARALQVSLTLPQGAVRPAAEVAVSGSVQTPEGQPAKAAVLLFAVDEGMLMGASPLPDWESVFLYHHPMFSLPSRRYVMRDREGGVTAPMLPGLWLGDRWEKGKWSTAAASGGLRMVDVAVDCCEEETECFAAYAPAVAGGAAANGVKAMKRAVAPVAAPCMAVNDADGLAEAAPAEGGAGDAAAAPAPHLRNNFEPVAVWAATLTTDAEGHFAATFRVPDTLTTYKVFCVAADDSGDRFANRTEKLQVNQPVMLTPATPFFMSMGDRLLLPLTVTNATDTADTWQVSLQGGGTQPIRLDAHATGTLYFEISPDKEGEQVLQWTARSEGGADAVEGRFPVRYPAPLLKEVHHLVLDKAAQGEGVSAELKPAALLAPELADSARGELWVEMSANPLLHLADCVDFLVSYPYGCTEQISTGLLPWLMYDRLSPFCAPMAEKSPAEVATMVDKAVADLLKRQQRDGGLSYWSGGRESCFWASAHAALVLTLVQETQHKVPADKLEKLCAYVRAEKAKLVLKKEWENVGPLLKYEVARVMNDRAGMNAALAEALQQDEKRREDAAVPLPRPFYCWVSPSVRADLQLLQAVQSEGGAGHAAFLTWLRYRARDYRHPGTWTGAWTLLALHEYLAQLPPADVASSITLPDGRSMELTNGVVRLKLADYGTRLNSVKDAFTVAAGTTYVTVKAKALPQQTEYPGVTEKGLQITRLYEKKGSDGVWRPAADFGVGDVVRVSLTCAKGDRDIDYFVLEDYLPACMEAVNPAIPTQAAGIEFVPWSAAFDNKEYLRDRVRGFCTRWTGRNVLNMVYFARVKYAGSATAPPAQAQLMYEPQVYGLSPNTKVNAK